MKKLRLLVSLTTEDNDFQREQASEAERLAKKLDLDVHVLYADGDAIVQSQQILNLVQGPEAGRPDGILLHPVSGTSLPHVARAAVQAGIGWGVMGREPDYINELRKKGTAPVFCVTSDHTGIGRIQAQQAAALAPKGGNILYVQGPADSGAALRTSGMLQRKPANVNLIMLRGKWTEDSGYKAVSSWARLSTSQKVNIEMFCAQNDAMAMGARKAIQELPDRAVRDRWLAAPFTGVDGLSKTGQAFVRTGLLAATIIVTPNTPLALELLSEALRKAAQPPAVSLTAPVSFPALEELSVGKASRERTLVSG